MSPHRHRPKSLQKMCYQKLAFLINKNFYPNNVKDVEEAADYMKMPSSMLSVLMEILETSYLRIGPVALMIKLGIQGLNLTNSRIYLSQLLRWTGSDMVNIQRLELSQSRNALDTVSGLPKAIPNIRVLNLSAMKVTDEVVTLIVKHCPLLVDLDLTACPITDAAVTALCSPASRCPTGLRRLCVSQSGVSIFGARAALCGLNVLHELDFDGLLSVMATPVHGTTESEVPSQLNNTFDVNNPLKLKTFKFRLLPHKYSIFNNLATTVNNLQSTTTNVIPVNNHQHNSNHNHSPLVSQLTLMGYQNACSLCPDLTRAIIIDYHPIGLRMLQNRISCLTSLEIRLDTEYPLPLDFRLVEPLLACQHGQHLRHLALERVSGVKLTVIGKLCPSLNYLELNTLVDCTLGSCFVRNDSPPLMRRMQQNPVNPLHSVNESAGSVNASNGSVNNAAGDNNNNCGQCNNDNNIVVLNDDAATMATAKNTAVQQQQQPLRHFSALNKLVISGPLLPEVMQYLMECGCDLKHIDSTGCTSLDDQLLLQMLQRNLLTKLESIAIKCCDKVSGRGLRSLLKCDNELQQVRIHYCRLVCREVFQYLVKWARRCRPDITFSYREIYRRDMPGF